MWHVWSSMKETMNTVTAIATNHAESIGLSVFLNNITNFFILFARFNNLDSTGQTLVRNFDEFLNLGLDITDEKCLVQITVKSAMIHGHVYVAKITVFERSRIRYTVTDYFVYGRATTGWKLMIVEGRRITVALKTGLVNYSVKLGCRYTDVASLRCFVEDFSTKLWNKANNWYEYKRIFLRY